MSAATNHPDTVSHGNVLPRPADGGEQKHPGSTPHRGRLAPLAMLFGLFGAAAVWFFETEVGETLTAQVCFGHNTTPLMPPWLMPAIIAVTACALLIGIAGAGVAWWNWRITRTLRSNAVQRALDTGNGRQHFLAMAGLLLSLLFLIGLVAASLAVLLVSPCSVWR